MKTKTAHIVDQLTKQDYKRQLREEFTLCTRQETKTIMIARFHMLETGTNFKGTMIEDEGICSTLVQRSWFFARTRWMLELMWLPRIMRLSLLVRKLFGFFRQKMRAKKATILYRLFLKSRHNLILSKSSWVRSKSAKSGDRSYSTESGYEMNRKSNISPPSLAQI